MQLVFFFLAFFLLLILLSNVHLEAKDIILTNIGKTGSHFELKLSLYLCNKIKWFSFTLKDAKLRKLFQKQKEKTQQYSKQIKRKKQKEKLEIFYPIFLEAKPQIEQLQLSAKIGINDIMATTFAVGATSIFLSLVLPHFVESQNSEKCFYEIIPLYEEKNLFDVRFHCIISVKMVHIMHILDIFLKQKGRSDKYERTSDRRSYEYGYEQH